METKSPVDNWKTGTNALALCNICGGEYPTGTALCPDCNVSLSTVRRCPNCHRVVSAHHTRCVHCRTPFTQEPQPEAIPLAIPATGRRQTLIEKFYQFRSIVISGAGFLFALGLGLLILHQIEKPGIQARVIAKSSILRASELHRSPSLGSASAGKLLPGTTVDVTGFRRGDQGLWMTLALNGKTAYAQASDLTPPLAVDAEEGASALKLYLSGLEASDSVDAAVKAVDYYAQTFPASPHRDELRWILAERLKTLSAVGGSRGSALRSQAKSQYDQLATTNSSYAEKAHEAMAKAPATAQEWVSSPRKAVHKSDELQIVDDAGTHSLTVASQPHEVLVLTRTEVVVHTGKWSQSSEGMVIPGHVAYNVKANGIVAIPAGALCELKVVGSDQANLSLKLTSIEIDHRVYAVKSTTTEIASGAGSRRAAANAFTFHLDAPLVLQR